MVVLFIRHESPSHFTMVYMLIACTLHKITVHTLYTVIGIYSIYTYKLPREESGRNMCDFVPITASVTHNPRSSSSSGDSSSIETDMNGGREAIARLGERGELAKRRTGSPTDILSGAPSSSQRSVYYCTFYAGREPILAD